MARQEPIIPSTNYVAEKIRKQKKLGYISNENVERLVRSESAFSGVIDHLVKGVITFADFAYLSENEAKVIDLCEISEELKPTQVTLEEILKIRRAEMDNYWKFHHLLSGFWTACKPAVAGE